MNNNSYFNKMLIKIVYPDSNDSFNLELTGNETEIKDLIATILNVPITHIKGIKDIYNNYYTFSSALRNPTLTRNYSPYYTIVLGNSYTSSDTQTKTDQKSEKIQRILTYLKDNNYISQLVYKHIMNVIQTEGTEYNNNEIINLLEKTDINDEESLKRCSKIIMTYTNVYSNNIQDGEVSILSQKTNQNTLSYNTLLDNVQEYFETKEDFFLLKQLLIFENKNIIKTIETFEEDNDLCKLLFELNQLIIKYKEKEIHLVQVNSSPSTNNNANHSKQSSPSAKWSVYSVSNKNELSGSNEDNNDNVITKNLNFIEKIFFNYQQKINSNYYETFEFQNGNNEHSLNMIKQKCKEFINNTIKFRLKNDQAKLEKLNYLIETKDSQIQEIFKLFLNHLDKTKLSDDIFKLLNANKSAQTTPKVGNSVYHKSNSITTNCGMNNFNNNSPINRDNNSPTNNNQKNNETHEFIKVIQNIRSLSSEQKSRAIELFNLQETKMMKLFQSFKRNKISLTKQSLIKAMSNLSTTTTPSNSNKNNYNTNIIQPQQVKENKQHKGDSSRRGDKENSLDNIIRKIPTKKKKMKPEEPKHDFISFCNRLCKEGLFTQKEIDFIIEKYNSGDEAIKSFYEVYIGFEDKDDFVESTKMYLNKHKVEMDNQQKEGNNNNNDSILKNLYHKSSFTQKQRKIIDDLYKQQNGTLLSVLEVYNEDKDTEDAIESIELLLKKISKEK